MSSRDWATIPPRQIRLDQLITTKRELDLHSLLAKDSTFYGDLFPHVVLWRGEFYLEDGLHRALRAALHQRIVLHARVLDLNTRAPGGADPAAGAPPGPGPGQGQSPGPGPGTGSGTDPGFGTGGV